ncbi:hypothetical protein LEP1GSC124_1091 [Leptospira interrogans serovar Pyrogenes str. 200701872]|uniref:Uncharacterized protein n=1 Tax=Leptospira interrogans serovar Pyrogenes str. 200701872 TaxID=1193029 RepID=M6ZF01_LEPIR|nr:hypothetical protein LEP1GSC124_1091 [Leptospira interrogans serovar Pyrogenes str. 200701872]
MKILKVQTGKFKGKSIETPPAIAGNTNFTPAILKKSVFDIIGSLVLKGRLIEEESAFVDFFAGSGQMGLEGGKSRICKSRFIRIGLGKIR